MCFECTLLIKKCAQKSGPTCKFNVSKWYRVICSTVGEWFEARLCSTYIHYRHLFTWTFQYASQLLISKFKRTKTTMKRLSKTSLKLNPYRALESKNSHKFPILLLQRVLYLMQWNFARSLASAHAGLDLTKFSVHLAIPSIRYLVSSF